MYLNAGLASENVWIEHSTMGYTAVLLCIKLWFEL